MCKHVANVGTSRKLLVIYMNFDIASDKTMVSDQLYVYTVLHATSYREPAIAIVPHVKL